MGNAHLTHPKYRPDIDGLRAIAVLAVVLFHAFPYSSALKGGFIGVDIFFVISGFLITSIIIGGLYSETFTFYDFYVRRVKRIFPVLIIVLIFTLLIGWVVLLANEYKQLGKHVVGGSFFISNFILWNESGYFDTSSSLKPLLHLWSLGVEEQFYIIWPVLLYVTYKRKQNIIFLVGLVLLCSLIYSAYEVNVDSSGGFYSPISRFWELMSGSFVAVMYLIKNNSNFENDTKILRVMNDRLFLNICSLLGAALLFFSFYSISSDVGFPGFVAVLPILAVSLLILAGSDAVVNKTVLSNRVLVWFGLISFPLYLWHWPLLSFARIINGEISSGLRNSAVVLSVLLAWISYKLVERPIRKNANDFYKFISLLFVMVMVSLIGIFVYTHDGFPDRTSLQGLDNQVVLNLSDDELLAHKRCMDTLKLDSEYIRFCRLEGNNYPAVAIIGDSHGAALYQSLSDELKSKGVDLLMLGGRLFTNVAAYRSGSEKEFQVYQGGVKATNYVANSELIKTVIVVSRGESYIDDDWKLYLLDRPEITDRSYIFEQGVREVINLLLSHNKRVIFVIDNPEIDVTHCSQDRPFRFSEFIPGDCKIMKTNFLESQKKYRQIVKKVMHDYANVEFFDSSNYLCDSNFCYGKIGKDVLYGDGDHLSYAGAALLAKPLSTIILNKK